MCTDLVAATERSALESGRCLGRGDPEGALEAGAAALREGLDALAFRGHIRFGIDGYFPVDDVVGRGGEGGDLDLAIGPVQEAIVARGQSGAISVLAATEPGALRVLPDMYMKKIAVGPLARGCIDVTAPVVSTIEAIADAFGRRTNDVTAIVLNRPRHDDLIEEIRSTGARIKLIQDGDVMAAMSSAIRGTNDHLAIGIGSSAESVISAAAMRCLGGELQGQLWPVSRTQIRNAAELGIEDVSRVFRSDELVRADAIVVATGVSGAELLRGVRYVGDGARTHSIVMCGRCNRVRFVDTTHQLARDRPLEVRI
jgi:fructose-1,6-bisphosphatase II